MSLVSILSVVLLVHWRLGLSLLLSCCIRQPSQFSFAASREPSVAAGSCSSNSIQVFRFSKKAAGVIRSSATWVISQALVLHQHWLAVAAAEHGRRGPQLVALACTGDPIPVSDCLRLHSCTLQCALEVPCLISLARLPCCCIFQLSQSTLAAPAADNTVQMDFLSELCFHINWAVLLLKRGCVDIIWYFVFQDTRLPLGIESSSTLVLLIDPVDDSRTNLTDERYFAAHESWLCCSDRSSLRYHVPLDNHASTNFLLSLVVLSPWITTSVSLQFRATHFHLCLTRASDTFHPGSGGTCGNPLRHISHFH